MMMMMMMMMNDDGDDVLVDVVSRSCASSYYSLLFSSSFPSYSSFSSCSSVCSSCVLFAYLCGLHHVLLVHCDFINAGIYNVRHAAVFIFSKTKMRLHTRGC